MVAGRSDVIAIVVRQLRLDEDAASISTNMMSINGRRWARG
jgi:hypothetical protein